MKNKLIDNLYLRAFNMFLDYGGLAVSAAGGAAMGDYDHAVFNEASRGPLAGFGLIGAFTIPGLDSIAASGNLLYSDSPGDNTLHNEYIRSQAGRNMFAYFGAWQLMEGLRYNSPINIATGVVLGGLALAGQVFGSRAKKELESRIMEKESPAIAEKV